VTAFIPSRRFASWGRVTRAEHRIAVPAYRDALTGLVRPRSDTKVLAVGLGRSYGDTALNAGGDLIDMTRLNRVIALDNERGVLKAEAGLSVDDALQLIVPKGWFFKTTPGTRLVTLGGMVANDVHGKNHHRVGSFGCSVTELELLCSDAGVRRLSSRDNMRLFAATIGGLGLTGLISTVEVELAKIGSAFLDVERQPFGSVTEFLELADASADTHEHTVAWVDCAAAGPDLGRGIFQRANWCGDGVLQAHADGSKLSVPMDAPEFVLNGAGIRLFNSFYYRAQRWGASRQRLHYSRFFYPLDNVRNWNRFYGRRGLYQYQCVLPPKTSEAGLREMLAQITRAGTGSFLAVLKTFGSVRSPGMLSFPRPGSTLALDFPNRGSDTLALFARLDSVVQQAGGALYPAKDGRMPAAMFRQSFPDWQEFAAQIDPAFGSDFWRRVSA
jgi:FAD/FMN-containing dehydrogenase